MEEAQVVQSLAALAQPVRLRIYRLLVTAGPGGRTPGDLAEELGVAPTTLSFHLKELVHAALVSQERDGRKLIYRANFERMNSVLGFLTEHCCSDAACAPDACSPASAARRVQPGTRRRARA